MVRKAVIAMAVIVCAVCVGCESHAQNKKLAKERWDKASVRMKLVLAQQQYDEGDYEQAEKTSRECVKADPDNAYGRVLYGKVLLANGAAVNAKDKKGRTPLYYASRRRKQEVVELLKKAGAQE